MSVRTALLLISTLVFVSVFIGCSDEVDIGPSTTSNGSATGTVKGEVNPAGGDFELQLNMTEGPDGPLVGPFVLRGGNIRYDDALEALLVDFSVINRSERTFPEPVTMTFIQLLPPDVTVLNPDNEEHGPGAAIVFQFSNDDGKWTPGEESEPRTVQFGVAKGTSIGFVARLDVGMDPKGGAIGGVVWADKNENGKMDEDEPGIGGVEILLASGDQENLTAASKILRMTRTHEDGTYRFDGLRAGFYTVFKAPKPHLRPTTPPVIEVILVEGDDGVSDFLMANFGCFPVREGDVAIRIGDYIRASGKFITPETSNARSGALVAREIVVFRCGDHECVGHGELAGTVNGVNRQELALHIMSEWITFPRPKDEDDVRPDDFEVGDRARAEVEDMRNGVMAPLKGLKLAKWTEEFERATGYVKRIGGDVNNPPAEIVILDKTVIVLTPDTEVIVREVD